jgi:hypothetical protein
MTSSSDNETAAESEVAASEAAGGAADDDAAAQEQVSLVVAMLGCDADQAQQLLDAAGGNVQEAIDLADEDQEAAQTARGSNPRAAQPAQRRGRGAGRLKDGGATSTAAASNAASSAGASSAHASATSAAAAAAATADSAHVSGARQLRRRSWLGMQISSRDRSEATLRGSAAGEPLKITGRLEPPPDSWVGVDRVLQTMKEKNWASTLAKITATMSGTGGGSSIASTMEDPTEFDGKGVFDEFYYQYLQPPRNVAYSQVYFGKDTAAEVLSAALPWPGGFMPDGAEVKEIDRSVIAFLSSRATTSGTHRDQTPSILYCVWGTKAVYIAPPDVLDRHHKQVEGHEDWLAYDPFDDNADSRPSVWQRVDLIPGEAVYIPKGWWHNVFSSQDTIGLSVDITIANDAVASVSATVKRPRSGSDDDDDDDDDDGDESDDDDDVSSSKGSRKSRTRSVAKRDAEAYGGPGGESSATAVVVETSSSEEDHSEENDYEHQREAPEAQNVGPTPTARNRRQRPTQTQRQVNVPLLIAAAADRPNNKGAAARCTRPRRRQLAFHCTASTCCSSASQRSHTPDYLFCPIDKRDPDIRPSTLRCSTCLPAGQIDSWENISRVDFEKWGIDLSTTGQDAPLVASDHWEAIIKEEPEPPELTTSTSRSLGESIGEIARAVLEPDWSCGICQEEFMQLPQDKQICQLKCAGSHAYCSDCIAEWQINECRAGVGCPLCGPGRERVAGLRTCIKATVAEIVAYKRAVPPHSPVVAGLRPCKSSEVR